MGGFECYYDDLFFFAPFEILFCVETTIPFVIAILDEGFGCFQQTVYIPTFLPTFDHIGRELPDGGKC